MYFPSWSSERWAGFKHNIVHLFGSQSSKETTEIINRLKGRGGKEQLLMFLTGPAGSGKSTAMRVSE